MKTSTFNSNLWKSVFGFWLIATIVFIYLLLQYKDSGSEVKRNNIVALNEIERLAEGGQSADLHIAVEQLQSSLLSQAVSTGNSSRTKMLVLAYVGICIFLESFFLYIYLSVIRPFRKLDKFAAEVAAGNFDFPLQYERNNMFGAFTWAFDNMRLEIKKARICEKEAIENNKTVIATISHDIKTPIASIRAYCEALLAGMDRNPERRQRYTSVILEKCDEVSKLTNDLFLHSLSDLDKLKMNFELYNSRDIIHKILDGITFANEKIEILNDIPAYQIKVDARRLEQVYENLIGNAMKYSGGGKISVSHRVEDEFIVLSVQDYGSGITDEDMPFIFEKFYRGRNTSDKTGAGLGLYIVKYIIEQMDGAVQISNTQEGLLAEVYIKIICNSSETRRSVFGIASE